MDLNSTSSKTQVLGIGSCSNNNNNIMKRPQKDLSKTGKLIMKTRAEALFEAKVERNSSSVLSLFKMSTIAEPQVQKVFVYRNRLRPMGCCIATAADYVTVGLAARRRRNLVHLSAWAALLTLLAVLSGPTTRWLEAEAIKLQPDGVEKFYWTGEQFVITCQNNNNIKNAKIRWYGPDDQEITEDHSRRVHTETSGNHGHRLVVHDASAPNDEGNYKCTVGMRDERQTRESIGFRLKLYRETSFSGTNDSVVLIAGREGGSLKCHVQFDPSVSTATVTWARGVGPDQKRIELLNDPSYQVREYDPREQISELIVSPVNKSHDDWYTCSASAITDKLSRIKDHPIRLETHYPPHFDTPSHTVWIERSAALNGGASMGGRLTSGGQHASGRRHNPQQQQHYPQPGSVRPRPASYQGEEIAPTARVNSSSAEPQIVSVELRCSCEANPEASIIWSASGVNFALTKGQPAHIVDERTERHGHNTTSILVIDYNLAQNWPHKHDIYTCSASNKLGKATKKFNIEQSDPPPAFHVGQHKSYDPQSKLYEFTLLGPNWNNNQDNSMRQQQAQEIVPPVDSFRIRAASPNSETRRLNEPSVQVSLMTNENPNVIAQDGGSARAAPPKQLSLPQNFTVNLSRLPSGPQRLFLEAHNAVGWSPNATYLGDYYIVSGASARASGHNTLMVVASSLLAGLMMSLSFGCRQSSIAFIL